MNGSPHRPDYHLAHGLVDEAICRLRPSHRAIAAGFLSILVLATAGSEPSLAQTAQTTLTATPASIAITVLAGHTSTFVSVAVTTSQAIPASEKLGATMLGDLVRDDSAARIPASAFQPAVQRDSSDPTNQSFVLTLTPALASVDPGKYSGNVRVTGAGVNSLVIPVTVNLQGGSAQKALVLLLTGLLVGWLLKWYTDAGSKLAAQSRRYQSFLRKLGTTASANLPKFVLDEIDDVNQGFSWPPSSSRTSAPTAPGSGA